MKDYQIVISIKTILLTIGLLIVAWLMFLVRDVLLILFASLALALSLDPLVDKISKKRISRGAAILLTLGLLVAIFIFLGSLVVNPLVQQTKVLYEQLPTYTEILIKNTGLGNTIDGSAITQLTKSTGNLLAVTKNAVTGVFGVIIVLVFTVYLLLDLDSLRKSFVSLFPKKDRGSILHFLIKLESRLGGWLRGQLTLMIIVGVLTFIGLTILQVEEALALAVLAGLLEIVPIIGFIIGLIPAIIIGFMISPITGFAILGLYTLVQQLENNLIVPKVMQKAVGFNPLVTMFVLLIGGKLFGLTGMLLAIPMTIVLSEIINYFIKEQG